MSPIVARLTFVVATSLLFLRSAATDFVSDSPSLPPEIYPVLPECAQGCLSSFIREELSSCGSDPTSLYCLCEARSANGFALGEGALACVADECPFDYVNSTSVGTLYSLCARFQDAARNTHSVLLASVATSAPANVQMAGLTSTTFSSPSFQTPTSFSATPTTSSTLFTTSTSSSISTTMTTTTTTTRAAETTMTSTTAASTSTDPSAGLTFDTSEPPIPHTPTWPTTSSVSTATASTSLTRNPAAATSTAASGGPVLNGGQVAGITIAGLFTTGVAAGLLVFIFCGKKIREKRRRRASDGDYTTERGTPHDPEKGGSGSDGAQDFLPETPLIPPPRAPRRNAQGTTKAHQFLGLPAAPNQHRQSWWNKFGRASSKPPPPPPLPDVPPKLEIAQTTYLAPSMGGISSEPSPRSIASYQTTSQLLPDKPSYQPGALQVYEKRTSGETAQNQPVHLGHGVGLRVISPTPEPQNQPLSKGWPQVDSSQRAVHGQIDGAVLASKMSDPFIARTNEQHQQKSGLVPAFRASRNELPRLNTFAERDARSGLPSQSRMSQLRPSQPAGIPHFRSLVNPQGSAKDTHHAPQLPQAASFSPLTPGFANQAGPLVEAPGVEVQQGSIMSRPRGSSSPFFSSQPSQNWAFRAPGRDRSKRNIRPETHYTTSSETEFEDDEPVLSANSNKDQTNFQNANRTHISINGIAELPGLSPVTESPASKKTSPYSGTDSTHAPSPLRGGGASPDPQDETNEAGTPISKVRYPGIPGTGVSPKREVQQVKITLDSPSPRSSPSQTPGARSVATFKTDEDDQYDSDIETRAVPNKNRPKLQPSPLRPAKPAQNNLREAAATAETLTDSGPAGLPSETSNSAVKFLSAAARLAASAAGTRGPAERGLGNWPVQPVRPVLRNTQIPAPIGVPAHAGSQPVTPIDDDAAFSPSNDGPYAVAAAVVQPEMERGSIDINQPNANGLAGGRVLLSRGEPERIMHAPTLSQTQIPRPNFAQRSSPFPPQRYAADWRPQPPQHQQLQPYNGPRLSAGPGRYSRAPTRETEQERTKRLEIQRLKAQGQEDRRNREIEQARLNGEGQRAAWEALRR